MHININRGFTILELAVTVIIIAVIAVVALPMYKHAILKSRFSTVMPMAKAVADAQEIYYLGNNQYALGKEDLDIAPVEAENTQVSLSPAEEDEEYIYVAAHRTDIPNVRYIMYQKNSPKFAGNIHCEADANDEDALWLCEKALHGTELTGKGASSIQGDDYKTFLLAGANETGDYFSKTCSGSAQKTCSCGGPVTGSCNDETGTWVYENDCPTPDPDESEECPAGYIGSRTRHAVCENGAYVNKWTDNCELACPAHAVCDDNGNVTGCERGYYQEGQTCKQEIACDNTNEPKKEQPCASGCGKQTRSVTCDYTKGTWVEGQWQGSCAGTKPDETKPCGNGYSISSANATRSVTCSESNGSASWNEGNWNYSACGCSTSTRPQSGYIRKTSCVSGYAQISNVLCSGSTWTKKETCVTGKDACLAQCSLYCKDQGAEGGYMYNYNTTDGSCSCGYCLD